MATRVTSTRLIGRAAELAELEAALADAADGRPSIVFLAGESGVGKSRLLAELERQRGRGRRARADRRLRRPRRERAAVRAARGRPAPARPLRRPGADRAGARGGGAAAARARPGAPASPARTAPRRGSFEGLLSLLDALGAERPVLLVIEDLHWADRSTRAALAFLARSLVAERVLVIGSYRPDELHRRHPAAPAAGRSRARLRSARRITLEPLTHAELADQLADILGAPPEAELLERLWKRSGGNPLYCEELLAAGPRRPRRGAGHAARRADAARRGPVRGRAGDPAARRRRPADRPSAARARPAASTSARCATRCARRSTATSSSPTTTAATASATRCCARWSRTTCCPASAPRCTWRSPARSSSASTSRPAPS